MSPAVSPRTRSRACRNMKRLRSVHEKKSRWASPLAKWKIEAPTIIVLSTSKKAAAPRSGPTGSLVGGVSVARRAAMATP